MTPADLKSARKRLGLSARALAEALHLGVHGGRTVRRWESGETPISGPAQVAIELMIEREHDRPKWLPPQERLDAQRKLTLATRRALDKLRNQP